MENSEKKKEGRRPDYRGNISVSIWINKDKNGKAYMTGDIGGIRFNCFKNEPKQPQTPVEVESIE